MKTVVVPVRTNYRQGQAGQTHTRKCMFHGSNVHRNKNGSWDSI